MASIRIKPCGSRPKRAQHRRIPRHELALGVLVISFGSACSPEVQVGTWTWACTGSAGSSADSTDGGTSDAAGTSDGAAVPIVIPWSTGFEDGFCDYPAAKGFCYEMGAASREIVQSPVHSGRFAAAFTIDSTSTTRGPQTRCFREGSLPREAYYGAWYFIPTLQTNTGNWNLFHFQGGAGPGPGLDGLWDVSLVNDPSGNLKLSILDFLVSPAVRTSVAPLVPIGSWFHIQFFLRRAADNTGEVAVYQDGAMVYHVDNVVTDNTAFQQWYVGNLASTNALMPPQSTIYVDDVEISESR